MIIDYEEKSEQTQQHFLSNPRISKTNKEYIKRFLATYKVRRGDRKGLALLPSRVTIVMNHLPFLLERTQDLKKDMHKVEKIDAIFQEIEGLKIKWQGKKKPLSDSYKATIINVSVAFSTWLNDGTQPEGFKNIQPISRKAQERKLNPDDMITWEDGLKASETTTSVQLKAILMGELDSGLRPSEFVDVDYGNVKVKDNFLVIYIKRGKGEKARFVTLWRSVPFMLKWLQAHPTKKANDPLWVQEYYTEGRILRYQYPAIQKQIKQMFLKAKIEKPCYFYNLRHSAVTLSKKDNVPPELAAQKFGHTLEYYAYTYGRLNEDDILERYSKHYGITKDKEELKQNVKCRCGAILEPGTEICSNCGQPTTVKKALEFKSETDKRLEEMDKNLKEMQRVINIIARAEGHGIK